MEGSRCDQAGLNGRNVPYPRGFVLGGSSSLSKFAGKGDAPMRLWLQVAPTEQ